VIRRPKRCLAPGARGSGFTLLELLLAVALASLLTLGLVQIVTASSSAGRLQRNQAQIEDHARFAIAVLSRAIREAGYRPEPWNDAYSRAALSAGNANDVTASGDRLALRAWSDVNCFGVRNPESDDDGHPRFFIRESVFDLTATGSLARLCRYGPSEDQMVTQVQRQGLVPGVESFQLRYGEDADDDGNVDRWVAADHWQDPQRIKGMKLALLLASENAVTEPVRSLHRVLDVVVTSRPDGKLRRVIEFSVALRGRAP
jgi:prepilin-type N-terminal cleavage/methylation domain-containing protein